MKAYFCTIFHFNYTAEEVEIPPNAFHIPAVRVARITVLARNRREAAARAYVRTVGRVRARKLRELNAPAYMLLVETRWKALAWGLNRTSNCLGNVWSRNTLVENYYVKVERLAASARPQPRLGWLLRASRSPSVN